ncbi:ligase-associated DNA damage response DEXH box helicase [Subsaximicrobium wynnwilliamsii]|uniref:Ligase-associated DNA damage response DEXH box helicase n=2 Tax=Subsaximicrobium wynnwilliamsii TaxID=291179 RepID=A0A5C6ZGB1_9FLAO|nr:ligase-associated DNA damage response DEXH box helicase [Subsaximicrobium wynnwilliamsii]TXD87682.1 ligase-associated DNA damage response DEXH box helicase [Subsaximicrobium wynnwilliamsii]TXE01428.1 ligase-associated DNA damage response DEXH box helicase [Subsaximicrobium wynnwilliamsii]
MATKGNLPFPFQEQTWAKYAKGCSGMVVAPTGFGKTFSVFLAVVIDYLNHPEQYQKGLKLLWVSPLRSLAKDLAKAMTAAIEEIGLDWEVAVRNGDTPTKIRRQQERLMPDVLISTPETLHLLFSQKNNSRWFKSLNCVAVDEWHELLGNKRGILTELAVARLNQLSKNLSIWGITATIGNLEEAAKVLIPYPEKKTLMIKSKLKKKIKVIPVLPDEVEVLPWAGHLGRSMASKIIPIIHANKTTLIFTNTRGQSELWYQILLEADPDLAGLLAIHHGSIDKKLRNWIEDSISEGILKAVVCTSSLDLGVDFKPVDCVIQIGSAKGIARFMQRAGRSGHSPYEVSKIYMIPTHSLEIIEAAALKEAVKEQKVEARQPMVLTFDVMVQFMVTLAVGEGFKAEETYNLLKRTHAFSLMTEDEFAWAIQFITQGGNTLKSYEEFHKVFLDDDGLYKVKSRRISMLHRMNIGAIVSDAMLRVKFMSGGYIGMVEEYFISKLKPNDSFILAGRVLELLHIKDMTVFVKMSKAKKAISPSWMGGRLPLSSYMSHFLRKKLSDALNPGTQERELRFLHPLIARQSEFSHIPREDEFLVELIDTKEGFHLFMYPFEGRLVHEVISALIAYRLSKIEPLTFTIAMNDYGFELLSDQEIPLNENNVRTILSKEHLMEDVVASINAAEMASRKFRDIAVISGLVVQSMPGANRNNKSLQSSSGLIFRVLEDNEPNNLLLRQAYTEVFDQQLEEVRLKDAFDRIHNSKLIIKKTNTFTPLSFPIKVDSLRQSLSSEKLDKRIQRIQKETFRKAKN